MGADWQGGGGSAFFAILVELVRVEITLLLRDALEPGAAVTSHWQLPTDLPSQVCLLQATASAKKLDVSTIRI